MKLLVQGLPAGQGSWIALSQKGSSARCNACGHTHCRPIAIPSSGQRLSAWRKSINKSVATLGQEPYTGPVCVELSFRFLRPRRPAHAFPVPDLDKLCRAVLDGLTRGAYVDDKQVVRLEALKAWTLEKEEQGVVVHVYRVEEESLLL